MRSLGNFEWMDLGVRRDTSSTVIGKEAQCGFPRSQVGTCWKWCRRGGVWRLSLQNEGQQTDQGVWRSWIYSDFCHLWWLRQRICLHCRRPRFNPWIGKIRWRREWQPTPVFLHGESHGQRSLRATTLGSCRVGHDWAPPPAPIINNLKNLFFK